MATASFTIINKKTRLMDVLDENQKYRLMNVTKRAKVLPPLRQMTVKKPALKTGVHIHSGRVWMWSIYLSICDLGPQLVAL